LEKCWRFPEKGREMNSAAVWEKGPSAQHPSQDMPHYACRCIKTPWRRRRQLWIQYANNEGNPPELKRCTDAAASIIKKGRD